MQDFIAALVLFFIIEPLQTEIAEKLASAKAPRAVAAQVAACARTALPSAVNRAASDPVWAVSAAMQLWAGSTSPETVLRDVAPGCAAALETVRPFPTEQSS